ncbi:hypothetical protein GCM10010275_39460 [Streptomyces litmocidini]|nr:hypothetical protein GCM10010275_39460 [Streptomyces litmocidini]
MTSARTNRPGPRRTGAAGLAPGALVRGSAPGALAPGSAPGALVPGSVPTAPLPAGSAPAGSVPAGAAAFSPPAAPARFPDALQPIMRLFLLWTPACGRAPRTRDEAAACRAIRRGPHV